MIKRVIELRDKSLELTKMANKLINDMVKEQSLCEYCYEATRVKFDSWGDAICQSCLNEEANVF